MPDENSGYIVCLDCDFKIMEYRTDLNFVPPEVYDFMVRPYLNRPCPACNSHNISDIKTKE